jgi:hypothetical protein
MFRDGEMVLKAVLAFSMAFFVLLPFPMKGWGGGLSIAPAYVEVNLDKGRPAGQFIIANLGEVEERYRIRAIHFIFMKDGSVRHIEPDKHSLAPWIKFNPTEFILASKSRRSIRYVIAPQGNLRPGEYWGAMELESLKTTVARGKDEGGREFQIQVIPSILAPMFGIAGKVRYQGNLKTAQVAPNEAGEAIQFLVENTGEGRLVIGGQYEIRKSSGEEVQKGTLARAYILPGSEQFFSSQLESKLAEGSYKVRVQCQSPQLKQPMEKEFDFVWKPPLRF